MASAKPYRREPERQDARRAVTGEYRQNLQAAYAGAVEALKFYAKADNWKAAETGIGMFPSEAETDGGNRARVALNKVPTCA